MLKQQDPPDFWSQVRQWIGLVIALGGMAYLVQAGMAVGRIEATVEANNDRAKYIGEEVAEHIRATDEGFKRIAEIATNLDSRVSRLEGRQEERDIASP